jgi:hypothetical protein
MGGKRKTRKGKRRHQDEKRYRNTMKRW